MTKVSWEALLALTMLVGGILGCLLIYLIKPTVTCERLQGPCELRSYRTSHGAYHEYELCPQVCRKEP